MFYCHKQKKDANKIAKTLKNEGKGKIKSDVTGSYTGISVDNEYPIQDADDL